MPKLAPVSWKILVKIFEADGFVRVRTKGSHISLVKPGVSRPIIIAMHNTDLGQDIIKSNMRTADMSRERYFKLLEQVK